MKLINCTPHPIVLHCPINGEEITIEPSGILPRVAATETPAGDVIIRHCRGGIDDHEHEVYCGCAEPGYGTSINLIRRQTGAVEGLPDPEPDTLLIVSSMVMAAVKNRVDLVAPDTGSTAIRDDNGRILSVTQLVCN